MASTLSIWSLSKPICAKSIPKFSSRNTTISTASIDCKRPAFNKESSSASGLSSPLPVNKPCTNSRISVFPFIALLEMNEEQTPKIFEVFHKWIHPFVSIKYIQNTVKEPNAKHWQDAPAKKAGGLGSAPSQLRNAQTSRKNGVVKEQYLVIRECSPQSIISDDLPILHKVVKRVAEECSREDRKDHPQSFMPFPVTEKGRIKEKIDQQFFEVVIKAVEKFSDGGRRQRPICVPQSVESSHAASGDESVSKNGESENHLKESQYLTLPAE